MKKILLMSGFFLIIYVNPTFAITITMDVFYNQASAYYQSEILGNEDIEDDIKSDLSESVPTDINSLVQQVLRESYLLQSEVLQDYADKVRQFNNLKENIRSYLNDLRNLMNDDEEEFGLGILPYLLYMDSSSETNSSSEPTTIIVGDIDEDSINTVNTFLSNSGYGNFSFALPDSSMPVPEPATMLLLGIGLIGLAGVSRKSLGGNSLSSQFVPDKAVSLGSAFC